MVAVATHGPPHLIEDIDVDDLARRAELGTGLALGRHLVERDHRDLARALAAVLQRHPPRQYVIDGLDGATDGGGRPVFAGLRVLGVRAGTMKEPDREKNEGKNAAHRLAPRTMRRG